MFGRNCHSRSANAFGDGHFAFRFVNSDPRAPIVGLRANTGARFENRDLPLALSLVRGGALGLRGLEAYS